MEEKYFLRKIINEYKLLIDNDFVVQEIQKVKAAIEQMKNLNGKLIFSGNGASAAIASHGALDFTKQAKVRSICFSDAAFITAFSNDYGYDQWVKNAMQFHLNKNDIGILISSSGKSKNITNAAKFLKENNNTIISFSGFEKDNPLNQMGDLRFWVDSKAYNIIECVHQIWLMMICDLIIGKTEYSVS